MDRHRRIWFALLLFLGTTVGSARASALKTYVFEGTLNRVDNPTGVFDSSIQVGSPFQLSVTIPASTPNDLVGNSTFGHYDFPTTTGPGMTLTIGGQAFPLGTPGNGQISVLIPSTGDSFSGYRSFGSTGDPNVNSVRVDFNLHSNQSHLASDALPDSVNLSDFPVTPSINLSYFYKDNRAYPGLGGLVQSVQVQTLADPVPEPSTILVLGAAIGFLGLRRLRETHGNIHHRLSDSFIE